MRALLVVVALVLIGCSRDSASDLTKEQEAALQALGETLDSDRERLATAHNALCVRALDRSNAADASGDRKSLAGSIAFSRAVEKLLAECDRIDKSEGVKQAGNWLVMQAQKADDQIIADWGE